MTHQVVAFLIEFCINQKLVLVYKSTCDLQLGCLTDCLQIIGSFLLVLLANDNTFFYLLILLWLQLG